MLFRSKLHFILILMVIFTSISSLWAERLTRVGVVDLGRIASQYFKESRAYRNLEKMIANYEENKDRILDEISQLETRKIEAENNDEEKVLLRLENEIYNKKEYLKEYNRIKFSQIKNEREKLSESQTFITDIMKEINYIAESEGFSLILKASDPDLIWWSPDADVTDMILKRLMQKAKAAQN